MIDVLVWVLFITVGFVVAVLALTLVISVLFILAAIVVGLYKGMKELISGRKVPVQDNTLPPPTRSD